MAVSNSTGQWICCVGVKEEECALVRGGMASFGCLMGGLMVNIVNIVMTLLKTCLLERANWRMLCHLALCLAFST